MTQNNDQPYSPERQEILPEEYERAQKILNGEHKILATPEAFIKARNDAIRDGEAAAIMQSTVEYQPVAEPAVEEVPVPSDSVEDDARRRQEEARREISNLEFGEADNNEDDDFDFDDELEEAA